MQTSEQSPKKFKNLNIVLNQGFLILHSEPEIAKRTALFTPVLKSPYT